MPSVVIIRTVTDQSVTRRIGPAASALQPDLQENKVWIGNASGIATPTDTGAKGRDLLALADDADLQAEIEARIEGATIAPGQVTTPIAQASNSAGLGLRNNTGGVVALLGPGGGLGSTFYGQINGTAFAGSGKISTTSAATDSVETAGGIICPGIYRSVGSGSAFFKSTNDSAMVFGGGNAINQGAAVVLYGPSHPSNPSVASVLLGGAELIRLTSSGARILGATPAPATSSQINLGNGTGDFGGRVVARSTAADAIQSLGGYRADAAGAYHFGDPTANDSWRITRSGTDLVIQRRESGSWVTKSTISA